MSAAQPHPFEVLTPDLLLDALDRVGLRGDGRLLALHSYENRVWQVWLEDGDAVVAKFYRPGRWSVDQLEEEHAFAAELAAAEVPVVAPLVLGGRTLHAAGGLQFAVYPRRGGRPPELDREDVLERLGMFLGRLHSVGAARPFAARPALGPAEFGHAARATILDGPFLPDSLRASWSVISEQAVQLAGAAWQTYAVEAGSVRLHGDCHPGNVLWTAAGPHFVDLDDARQGPPVQDVWMLLSGSRTEMQGQLAAFLRGYRAFQTFSPASLALIEPLRTLRLLHYSAWIAKRWQDPAFPQAFPWFGTDRYWQDRILELREQVGIMQEPPLDWPG